MRFASIGSLFLVPVFLCLVFCLPAAAQGLIIDDAGYEQAPRQPLYGDGGKSESEALAGVSKVDLRPYCPRPQHQGNVSTCTGWATGYAALTIAYAVRNGWAGQRDKIDGHAFSALYLYNQVKSEGDCLAGSRIWDALQLLEEQGDVLSEFFDQDRGDCTRQPTPEDLRRARDFRIKDYTALFGAKDPARVKIDKTKLSLLQRKPVIIGMRLRENFLTLTSANKLWLPGVGRTTELGMGHAMTVVGFDDGRGAFEIMNSWGEGWGQDGFMWVKYEDYAEHCFYAFEFSLADGVPRAAASREKDLSALLSGRLLLREPKPFGLDSIVFETACVRHLQNGVYEVCDAAWAVGQLYQLVAHGVRDGSYLYLFSVDSRGKVNVHWPRDGKLDEKFEGANESAVITNSRVRLVIPGSATALRLEETGEEYLVALFSKSPLRDVNAIIQQVKAVRGGALPERVRKVLGRRAVPAAEVAFLPGEIAFETPKPVAASILPVFIKISVNP